MNKYKQLSKALVRQAIISLGIVLFFVAAYFGTDSLVDSSAAKKTDVENKFKRDQGTISSLTTQVDKSTVAEKNFLLLQAKRDTLDFSADSDKLKDWLRKAKTQYRFSSNFKLSITPPKPATNPEFTGLNYDYVEHPGMKLEFSAISDAHVFAFLDAFMRQASGFIRIDSLSIKRTGDIDSATITQVRTGVAPTMVDVKVEFNWIGLQEKAAEPAPAALHPPVKQAR